MAGKKAKAAKEPVEKKESGEKGDSCGCGCGCWS
ncbi:Uncharacterised protein [uncultured archaeon]|nr:Uncharacterised protein [uncultured archaeon]